MYRSRSSTWLEAASLASGEAGLEEGADLDV